MHVINTGHLGVKRQQEGSGYRSTQASSTTKVKFYSLSQTYQALTHEMTRSIDEVAKIIKKKKKKKIVTDPP